MGYLNNTTIKKSAFKKLPPITIFKSITSPELFEAKINEIYNKENEVFMKEILTIIYEKLTTKDEEFNWSLNNYKEFKKEISKVDIKDISLLKDSMKKSLITKNTDIYQQLELFSTKTTWYPKKTRIKDETTNGYMYLEEEINISDTFYIINNLISYIKQYISRYLYILKKDIDKDSYILIEEIKEELLEGYIKEYSYLKDFPLFIDIYTNGYNEILKRLEKAMYEFKGDMEFQKNASIYSWSDAKAQSPASLRKYHKDHYKNTIKK